MRKEMQTCEYYRTARLTAQYAQTHDNATRMALEAALREAEFEASPGSLFQGRSTRKRSAAQAG